MEPVYDCIFKHDWKDGYYGKTCQRCGLFLNESYFDIPHEEQCPCCPAQ